MKTRYQIVTMQGHEVLTAEELAQRFDIGDKETGQHLREELRGQPRLDGLCGPMWGGYRDAEGDFADKETAAEVWIRYETWEAYDLYSR